MVTFPVSSTGITHTYIKKKKKIKKNGEEKKKRIGKIGPMTFPLCLSYLAGSK